MPFLRKPKTTEDEALVRSNFDEAFYLSENADLAEGETDPVSHYLSTGAQEGRDPTPWFSSFGYLNAYPDVALSGLNPFLHYLKHGRAERRALPWLDGVRADKTRPFERDPKLGSDEQMMRWIVWHHGNGAPSASAGMLREAAEVILARLIESGEQLYDQGDDLALQLHMQAVQSHFDEAGYGASHPNLVNEGADLLSHYCQVGWRILDNPTAGFDLDWYWREHLNPCASVIDPLLHYALVGKSAGLGTRHPDAIAIRSSGMCLSSSSLVRRACLFAMNDPHGMIDDHVIGFIAELASHSEIFVLVECELLPEVQAKLSDIASAVWVAPHLDGAVRSHAMLFDELVGWDRLADYDEVIIADDRTFLVKELSQVFMRMDSINADWWGLNAGYGLPRTRFADSTRIDGAATIHDIQSSFLQEFEEDFDYRFAVGGGLTAFRQSVLRDFNFREYVRSLAHRSGGGSSSLRFAIRLTQFLVQQGYRFGSFVEELYPLHPHLTEHAFDLVAQGHPLLSRALLAENPFCVPDLHLWQDRLRDVSPESDVELIAQRLKRLVDDYSLHISLHTCRDAEFNPVRPDLLGPEEMEEQDRSLPKYDNWWVFPACAYDGNLSGNDRAVFEAVRHDPAIRKIVLTRGRCIDLEGANVDIYPLMSKDGQKALLQSRVVFIKHSASLNVVFPILPERHLFVGLWHGIPFKRIGTASRDTYSVRDELFEEHAKLACVVSSSPIDRLAMSAGFQPLGFDQIWVTGLPRADLILCQSSDLPEDMQREERGLRKRLGEKRLILWCPTFRNDPNNPGYRFTEDEVEQIDKWLSANNAVLGIREHMADIRHSYSSQLRGPNMLQLPSSQHPNIEVLYRVSSCLLTDYSSCFFDYMLTGKAAISFAYDLESYRDDERGTFYDLERVFPGPVCRTFAELVEALNAASQQGFASTDPDLETKRDMFFTFLDNCNAERVVNRVQQLLAKQDNAPSKLASNS